MDNLIQEFTRPNRLETKNKDKKYHVQYARYCVSTATNHPYHRAFILNSMVYWKFYSNEQWILDDDLEGFLTDESGGARNRLKIVENLVKPMVKQYIGNAIRLNYNAKAVNISPLAINRRDRILARLKFMSEQAQAVPGLKGEIQKKYGVGDNPEETEQIFTNSFVDGYTKAINNLLRWSREQNSFDEHIVQITKHTALTGMGIHKGYEQNGEQVWDVTDPMFFLFDRAAKREDLKDCGYMGEQFFGNPAELFERFQGLSNPERQRLEKYTIQDYGSIGYMWHLFNSNKDRVPYYEMYWKDIEREEYGYVMDPYGYEYLARVNHEDSPYKDKDLIIPKTENYKKFLGEKNKEKKIVKYVDVLRYCIFTPSEVIGGKSGEDIVYEYGIAPYQETYNLDPSNVEFPYKVYCADYHNGEILSPIQVVIDPQRLLNRTISIMESHMNNARGTNMAYDKSMIDAQGGEEELLRNMNLSKPIGLNANRTGIQNAIATYGTNLTNQLNPFMQMTQLMRTVAQNVTGVNESMQGTASGANQLVGVQELNIQRGSLMQEKFYYGINNIMLQTFQSVASQGKRIYADSKRRLSMITGDDGAEEIIITKDMCNEDFRVFIDRAEPDAQEKQAANALILELAKFQLLGEKQVAEAFNRGDMDLVAEKLRETYNDKQMAAAMKAKADAAQAQALQGQMAQEQEKQAQENEANKKYIEYNNEKERQHDTDMQRLKDHGKLEQIEKKEILSKK